MGLPLPYLTIALESRLPNKLGRCGEPQRRLPPRGSRIQRRWRYRRFELRPGRRRTASLTTAAKFSARFSCSACPPRAGRLRGDKTAGSCGADRPPNGTMAPTRACICPRCATARGRVAPACPGAPPAAVPAAVSVRHQAEELVAGTQRALGHRLRAARAQKRVDGGEEQRRDPPARSGRRGHLQARRPNPTPRCSSAERCRMGIARRSGVAAARDLRGLPGRSGRCTSRTMRSGCWLERRSASSPQAAPPPQIRASRVRRSANRVPSGVIKAIAIRSATQPGL